MPAWRNLRIFLWPPAACGPTQPAMRSSQGGGASGGESGDHNFSIDYHFPIAAGARGRGDPARAPSQKSASRFEILATLNSRTPFASPSGRTGRPEGSSSGSVLGTGVGEPDGGSRVTDLGARYASSLRYSVARTFAAAKKPASNKGLDSSGRKPDRRLVGASRVGHRLFIGRALDTIQLRTQDRRRGHRKRQNHKAGSVFRALGRRNGDHRARTSIGYEWLFPGRTHDTMTRDTGTRRRYAGGGGGYG